MGKILFHPHISGLDAQRIAEEQGGKVVWRGGRVRLLSAMRLCDEAADALEAADHLAALGNLRAAHAELFGGAICVA